MTTSAEPVGLINYVPLQAEEQTEEQPNREELDQRIEQMVQQGILIHQANIPGLLQVEERLNLAIEKLKQMIRIEGEARQADKSRTLCLFAVTFGMALTTAIAVIAGNSNS